ncbi:serine/threonine-protein kinase [Actinomadura litoris]|uniref:serine/threonine-protein kinase n=1 Tax=Actinomadura litoris TaxID=2678616 RepID=UPI0012E19C2A|nr:serine/threonine-protein kinase [Actinomadura litoris]
MPEVTPLLPTDPEAIGGYELRGRLGVGGQGTVYLGLDERGRRAAIKLLHPHLITQETARTRFLAEVEIAKRVAPFCTAQVLDSGTINGQPYIASEFVDGPSLLASVKDAGPRGDSALERLAVNTITALAAIHKGGVVHRDFKPGNVLLAPDGPVVIDFGISRALDLSQSLTSSQVVGTPGYMAPEHIDGAKAGPEADMFAWAATMVFAATGRRAFPGTTVSAVALAVLHKEPDLDGMEGDLAEVVRDCLRKDPAERPTAAEVSDRLLDSRTPRPAPDDTEPRRPPEPPGAKRRRLGFAAVVLAVPAMVGALYIRLPGEGEGATAHPSPTPPGAPPSATPAPGPSKEPGQSPSPTTGTTEGVSTPPEGPGSHPSPAATKSDPAPTRRPSLRTPRPKSRNLGSLSAQDYSDYCRAHGYPYSAVWADQAVCSKDREGENGTIAGPTAVCRWKYSGRPNVRAEGRNCVSGA